MTEKVVPTVGDEGQVRGFSSRMVLTCICHEARE